MEGPYMDVLDQENFEYYAKKQPDHCQTNC